MRKRFAEMNNCVFGLGSPLKLSRSVVIAQHAVRAPVTVAVEMATSVSFLRRMMVPASSKALSRRAVDVNEMKTVQAVRLASLSRVAIAPKSDVRRGHALTEAPASDSPVSLFVWLSAEGVGIVGWLKGTCVSHVLLLKAGFASHRCVAKFPTRP